MKWSKNCLRCDNKQYYKNEKILNIGIKNNTLCRSCSKKDKTHTEETKQKMSASKQGKNNAFYGKKHTKETRLKMSENHADYSGKNHPMYSKCHPEETKQKMCKSHKGKKHTEKTKQKMRISHIKYIEEHKLNGGQLAPNYNPLACLLFDWANMYHDLHIQHAENGGRISSGWILLRWI